MNDELRHFLYTTPFHIHKYVATCWNVISWPQSIWTEILSNEMDFYVWKWSHIRKSCQCAMWKDRHLVTVVLWTSYRNICNTCHVPLRLCRSWQWPCCMLIRRFQWRLSTSSKSPYVMQWMRNFNCESFGRLISATTKVYQTLVKIDPTSSLQSSSSRSIWVNGARILNSFSWTMIKTNTQ